MEFDQDDFERLDGEIPSILYVQLARDGNIKLGTSEEVARALAGILDEAGNNALYKRAVKAGIKFTRRQLSLIGKDEEVVYEAPRSSYNDTGCGCLGLLLGLGSLLGNENSSGSDKSSYGSSRSSKKRHSGRCDGDCDNCPAHYGYRYGRWYYGHGHNHGCEFGGNKGGGGRD